MTAIVLMGNPNVGKSVVFSRLTGARVIASNYPGTTVDFSQGTMVLKGKTVQLIDAPGTYSLEPTNRAEEVAARIVDEADVIINVVDATNLERNLFLTQELLERGKPVVVALNMWDETKHLGIDIDVERLEEHLGVPVVPTVALTGKGIKELVEDIDKLKAKDRKATTDDEKWAEIGHIIRDVQTVTHRHHTAWDRLADLSIKPFTGIPIALLIIFVTFWGIRYLGEYLVGEVFEPLFEDLYKPIMMGLSERLGGSGLLHDLLIGQLIEGEVDFGQSMGLLTTGLFVPFAMVLPYITAFYLGLSLLEDSGYLPRLSTLADTIFHRLGMHGQGIVGVFLGLGCNVPGALSTRVLETRKERFISATLLAIAVPCMAQIAMIFGILGEHGNYYLFVVFGTLITLYLVAGAILNRYVQGQSPEIFLEIPPYRVPSPTTVLKKVWMRIGWFIKEAVPWLFFGVLLINVMYSLGIIEAVGNALSPVTVGIFGLRKEATAALMIGFLRKDLAVGMLLPLGMTAAQLTIAATILTIYFPCVATFAVLVKELGTVDTIKSTGIMVSTALIVGGLLRIALIGF